MDIAFLLGVILLWGTMTLLVWGLKNLEKPVGGRS